MPCRPGPVGQDDGCARGLCWRDGTEDGGRAVRWPGGVVCCGVPSNGGTGPLTRKSSGRYGQSGPGDSHAPTARYPAGGEEWGKVTADIPAAQSVPANQCRTLAPGGNPFSFHARCMVFLERPVAPPRMLPQQTQASPRHRDALPEDRRKRASPSPSSQRSPGRCDDFQQALGSRKATSVATPTRKLISSSSASVSSYPAYAWTSRSAL